MQTFNPDRGALGDPARRHPLRMYAGRMTVTSSPRAVIGAPRAARGGGDAPGKPRAAWAAVMPEEGPTPLRAQASVCMSVIPATVAVTLYVYHYSAVGLQHQRPPRQKPASPSLQVSRLNYI